MKKWEIIKVNNTAGMERLIVFGATAYDALMATGNLHDWDIISIKLIPHD